MLNISPELLAEAKKHGYVTDFKVPKKIRMYRNKKGDLNPSVTSVFNILPDPTWLKTWKKRVGEAEADRVSKQAMLRGTQVHQFAENYYTGSSVPVARDLKVNKMIGGFLNFVKEEGDRIKLIPDELADNPNKVMAETKFSENTYGYSGTADLPCDYDHPERGLIRVVADYKTSSSTKIKEESLWRYKMQIAAYIISFNDMMRSRGLGKESYAKAGYIIVFTHGRKSGVGEHVWLMEEEVIPCFKEFYFYYRVFMEIFERHKDFISFSIVER